jgi:ABC-2 type transport system permease protein
MGNAWKVCVAEYERLVHKRSFLLSLIGMPLLMGVIIAIAIITSMPKGDARPVGYVDLSGVTHGAVAASYAPDPSAPALTEYPTEEAARNALKTGSIQGYYLIPADYLNTRSVSLYTWGESSSPEARDAFQAFLTAHLLSKAPADSQAVLQKGIALNYRAPDSNRETAVEGFVVSAILPFVIGFFFVMVVMTSGGYLLQAVTTEKENRMVEIMMTSVSPLQLIGGKALGLIGVALTQVGVWIAALAVALVWGGGQVSWLRDVQLPTETLALAALFFLPTYVLLAGLMIIVGSVVTELQHGQQISGFFNLLFAVPFFFLVLIFTNPDSPILVFLTLFPTTSMMTIAMRWGMTVVPAWQIVLAFVVLVISAVASIWLAARVFRVGMLRYGQPLSLAGLVQLVRPGHGATAATAEKGVRA